MGCIEISLFDEVFVKRHEINRNMGCIEIAVSFPDMLHGSPINRNMGCIEILLSSSRSRAPARLIETWDVLKSP